PLSSSPPPFLPPLPQPLPPESLHNSPPSSLPLQPLRPKRSHLPPSRPTSLPPRVHRLHFLLRTHFRLRSPWPLQRVLRLRLPHHSLAPCLWWCQSAPLPRLCSRRVQSPWPPLNCSPPRARHIGRGRCSLSLLPPRVRPINSTCPSSLFPWSPSWPARLLSSAPSASAMSPCQTRLPLPSPLPTSSSSLVAMLACRTRLPSSSPPTRPRLVAMSPCRTPCSARSPSNLSTPWRVDTT